MKAFPENWRENTKDRAKVEIQQSTLTQIEVTCTGIRGADGKSPTRVFPTRREASNWAEYGHFCFAWHTYREIKS